MFTSETPKTVSEVFLCFCLAEAEVAVAEPERFPSMAHNAKTCLVIE